LPHLCQAKVQLPAILGYLGAAGCNLAPYHSARRAAPVLLKVPVEFNIPEIFPYSEWDQR